ncbi:tetratricopeptide repeat protein [Roseateles noduli]|uniref:tetratricopeptide repeat protein n=1 Tax=Roseateles noduli TaxID=2052484 RepID=UPI003D651390
MEPVDPDVSALRPATQEPLGVEALIERAELLIERRRWREAETVLRQGLALEPEDLTLLTELARTRFAQNDNDEALHLVRGVLAKDPSHFEGRYLLFHVLADMDEAAEAEAVILALIREFPGAPGFYTSYARLMLRALQVDKARGLVAEALRLAPDSHGALQAAALCDLVDGRRGDTAAMRRLLVEDPGSRETLSLVINALIDRGRIREAYRLSKELLRAQPDDPFALQRVKALAGEAHWALRPLWPLQRWGWQASVGLWVAAVAIGRLLERQAPEWAATFWICWLVYAVYSWIAPPLVRRLAAR